MSALSYVSTLDEVIDTSDQDLRRGIGFLAPDTVIEYVFYMRDELRRAQEAKGTAGREVARLQGVVSTLEEELANNMTMLNVGDVPASAPPIYDDFAPPPLPRTAPIPSNIAHDYGSFSASVFPSVSGTVWTWAHNGTKPNGIIEFLLDGGTKWFNGKKQGYWKLKNGGTILETEFNGVYHELEYIASEKKAVLKTPVRSPPSQMWIQGDRGEFPFGPNFSSSKIALHGHHNTYVQAGSNGTVNCKQPLLLADTVCEVVQIKPDTVAFKSQFGKYLSAQPNGSLEWNRDAANIWEFFTVGILGGNKITLYSYHGKYMSAQPNGRLEVNRDRAQAWEHFTVTGGLSSASAKLQPVHVLGNKLEVGSVITATAVFKPGTSKFTINLLKSDGLYYFHLDFRPPPLENKIVMNTKVRKGWEREIRASLPALTDGQLLNVAIECGREEFKVKVNGIYIDCTFPYRYVLDEITKISLVHGSNGNKWIALSCK